MRALPKKENFKKVDLEVNEELTHRPNIDHLIKRIESQRKRERRNSIIIGIAFFGLAIVVYFFTKS
jgi:hypothetical protein